MNYLILDDYSRLLETVTAFANTQGGTIIIGIRDSNRLIVDLNREQIERYSQEVPLDAIREALVNAVAHRAYDYEAPTRVTLFSDRIEFLNPGNFYAPINPENLKEGLSRYRNPLIADALRKKGYMEKQGIGITLIISSCLEAGLSEPQFIELEHHVKLVISSKRSTVNHTVAPQDPQDITSMRHHFSALGLFSSKEIAQYLGKSVSMPKKYCLICSNKGLSRWSAKDLPRGTGSSSRWQRSFSGCLRTALSQPAPGCRHSARNCL